MGRSRDGRTPGRNDRLTTISYARGGDGGGGGTPVDLCKTVPGDQGRECPDSAVSVYSIPIPRDVANVTIQGSGTATVIGDNSSVSVEVSGVRDDVLAAETGNGTLSFSETYRDLSPSGSSDELTLGIETTGLAGARLDGVTIWKDTDGDGLTDQRERIGFNTAFSGRVSTDPLDPDTDGDGLEDGEEVGEIIEDGERLPGRGDYGLVIGDNPNGEGQVVLRLLEGMVVSAGQRIEDPTGHKVEIDRNDRHIDQPGHANYDEVIEAIRNPEQIWEKIVKDDNVDRHYIAMVNGRWVVVRARWTGTHWIFGTAHNLDSLEEVQEYIEDWDLANRVYGEPLEEIEP